MIAEKKNIKQEVVMDKEVKMFLIEKTVELLSNSPVRCNDGNFEKEAKKVHQVLIDCFQKEK